MTLKIKLTKLIILIMAMQMLLPIFTHAETTNSMKLYLNGSSVYLNTPIEKSNDNYYMQVYSVNGYMDFGFKESSTDATYSRYGTELRVTYGSDVIMVNGKTQLFTAPTIKTDTDKFVSISLIAQIFGDSINIDETNGRIDITLKQKPTLPQSKTVYGTINLPNDQVAPDSGIVVDISVRGSIYGEYNYEPITHKYALIEAGEHLTTYNINFNDGKDYSLYTIQYNIIGSYPSMHSQNGYYSYSGTTYTPDNASNILIGNNTRADMTIIHMVKVSVELTNINHNIKGSYICAYGMDGNGISSTYSYYNSEDSYSIGTMPFELYVPDCVKDNKIMLSYELSGNNGNYVYKGYYNPNGTVPFQNDAGTIDITTDSLDTIKIPLLEGRTISGTVTFPQSMIDSKSPVDLWAISTDYSQISSSSYKNPGNTKVGYSIVVPLYKDNLYSIQISTPYNFGYVDQNGKINPNYTPYKFDVTNGDITDLNITILEKTITGTISLPDGELAGEGGVDVRVYTGERNDTNIFNQYETTIHIDENKNSADYSIILPMDYKANAYSCIVGYESLDGKYANGYHCGIPTVAQREFAVTLEDPCKYSINMTLIKMGSVSGTISLPQGDVASDDMNIKVDSGETFTNITLLKGETSVPYTLPLPTVGSYKIKYTFGGDYADYSDGYYKVNGSITDVSTSDENTTNINIQIKNAPTISGQISLPSGMTAPAGGYNVNVYANPRYGYNTVSKQTVNIPEGASSATFNLKLSYDNSLSTYILWYNLDFNTNELYFHGYYAKNGTTSNSDYAKSVFDSDTEDATNINFTLMKKIFVSGNVKLPNNNIAPSGGVRVSVYAISEYTNVYMSSKLNASIESTTTNAEIEKSQNLACIMPTPTSKVMASLETTVSTEATPSSSSASGGSSIGGSSSYSQNPNGDVTIAEGQNEATYLTALPDDIYMTSYYLRYNTYDFYNNYYPEGYYSPNGTKHNRTTGSAIEKSVQNVDITMLEQHKISGTITKPSNVTDSFYVHIGAIDNSVRNNVYYSYYSHINCTYVDFNSTTQTANYSIYVPADITDYILRYDVYYNDALANFAYYNSTKTTYKVEDATAINTSTDVANVDMTLLPIQPITDKSIVISKAINHNCNSLTLQDFYSDYNYFIYFDNTLNRNIESSFYIAYYGEGDKLIYLQKFYNNFIGNTTWGFSTPSDLPTGLKKVKIMVWTNDGTLTPVATPYTIEN